MPALLGLAIGVWVTLHLWAWIGVAFCWILFFACLMTSRFFMAAIYVCLFIFSAGFVFPDDPGLRFTREQYISILVWGLIVEMIKWGIKLWRNSREKEEPEIIINIVDDEVPLQPMKDVTPDRKVLPFRRRSS